MRASLTCNLSESAARARLQRAQFYAKGYGQPPWLSPPDPAITRPAIFLRLHSDAASRTTPTEPGPLHLASVVECGALRVVHPICETGAWVLGIRGPFFIELLSKPRPTLSFLTVALPAARRACPRLPAKQP